MKRKDENASAFDYCKTAAIEILKASEGKEGLFFHEAVGLENQQWDSLRERLTPRMKELLRADLKAQEFRILLEVSETLPEFIMGCLILQENKVERVMPPEIRMMLEFSKMFKKLAEE